MDTIVNRKKKKKELESISEKPFQDKPVSKENKFAVGKEIFPLPPDFEQLKEFDWEDPDGKKYMNLEEEHFVAKFGHLTHEELFQLVDLRY